MSMQSGAFESIPQLIARGLVSQKRLDEAVRRVLRAKEVLELQKVWVWLGLDLGWVLPPLCTVGFYMCIKHSDI